jgi:hypothetical protein
MTRFFKVEMKTLMEHWIGKSEKQSLNMEKWSTEIEKSESQFAVLEKR